ncbi:Bardet-Biedl syndrome 12 protein homolog [Esox lucius]|uniref:Bardet-Biedl syndrome 12 n=1 Tax=Esox lucius TaxID=8010 RepID=A0A3P9AK31_ESOLU|nr:Bardet-Biedl syndrome 12 protein homolog [Esox lucius]
MGSTIINQRVHIGLQQLTALGTVAHSFLGPNKKYKFIQDESTGECFLVCTCFSVMGHLELDCSIGQLANETIQAHQKVFRSGTCCLLFLAGVWSRAALECLHRGISIPDIKSAMLEGLDMCTDVCRSNSVSIADAGLIVSASDTSGTSGSPRTMLRRPALIRSQGSLGNEKHSRIKLSHSRHFREIDKDAEATPQSFSQAVNSEVVDIPRIAEALSHGCAEAMSLVVKACRLQSKYGGRGDSCRTFDVNKLVTCPLPGLSEAHQSVLPGCVVLLSAEQAALVHRMKEKSCQAVLIDGDLSEKYRHLGFNKQTDIRYVTGMSDCKGLRESDAWEDRVLTILLNNSVSLVVVSGEASEGFAQCCMRHCILVVERVRPTVLKDLAEATGAVLVTYATQLSKHCVGAGVKVSIWKDCSGSGRRLSTAVNIVADGSRLVTVVLTSSIQGKLQALEDQFWACAFRLHHALKDQKLLPGGGMTELLCVHHLQNHIEGNGCQTNGKGGLSVPLDKQATGGNMNRDYVLCVMADGWTDYISTLMLNSGTRSKVEAWTTINQQLRYLKGGLSLDVVFSRMLSRDDTESGVVNPDMSQSAEKVYDNVTVKLEAWRKALDLVFLVLQTDIEIITGIDPAQVESKSNVVVL